MFGGARAIGFDSLGALVAAAVLGPATPVSAWLSALIVALVLGVIAGLLALQGKSKLQPAMPRVAEQIISDATAEVRLAVAARSP
jgi:Putative Actinobacterial Holin-X, holin superfamily III